MTDQTQPQDQARIGFEVAMLKLNPNWRTEIDPGVVNVYRHFYQSALHDVTFLVQASHQQMIANLQAVHHTVIVAGREEEIAAAQAAAAEAAEKPAKAKAVKAKTAAKPAAKAAPKRKR